MYTFNNISSMSLMSIYNSHHTINMVEDDSDNDLDSLKSIVNIELNEFVDTIVEEMEE